MVSHTETTKKSFLTISSRTLDLASIKILILQARMGANYHLRDTWRWCSIRFLTKAHFIKPIAKLRILARKLTQEPSKITTVSRISNQFSKLETVLPTLRSRDSNGLSVTQMRTSSLSKCPEITIKMIQEEEQWATSCKIETKSWDHTSILTDSDLLCQ